MLNRNRLIRGILVAVVGVAAISNVARASDAKELLKIIPDDAFGFVMLRSVDTIDQRAAHIKELLNIQGMPAQVTPMGLMMLGLTPEELDTRSAICMVLMDTQKFGAGEGDPFTNASVVIVPAKSSEALLKKFNAEEPVDGIAKATIMGKQVYAGTKEKFVILGNNKDCVTRVMTASGNLGTSLPAARANVVADSDVYVSVSAGSLAGAYKELINSYITGMAAVMGPQAKDLEKIRKLIEETKAIDFAINITKEGIFLRYLFEPMAGTDLENLMKDTRTSADSLISVLPKEKYLVAFGSVGGYSPHSEKFGEQNIVANLVKQVPVGELDEAAVKEVDTELIKIIKNLGAFAMSASALPSGQNGMFGFAVVIESKDAPGMVASMRKIWDSGWKISSDPDVVSARKHLVHKADAETVGDAKIDTITLDVKALADEHEKDEDDLKTFETIMGREVVIRFGAVDSTHVVCTYGGGKARFEQVAKAVSAKSAGALNSDKGISETSAKLPTPRSGEMYIAVDNILQLAKSIAKAAGEEEEIPFDVPAIDAPLALSTVQDGSIQRGDLYIPNRLIVAVKKMIEDQQKAEAMSEFDEEDEDASDSDAADSEDGVDDASDDGSDE